MIKKNTPQNLQVAFPESNEDHRLALIAINGEIFAIVHGPMKSDGPIRLDCENWSLILLSPMQSKTNILISAKNIICLNDISSEEGMINIHASNYLVKFSHFGKSSKKITEMGECGEFQAPENSATVLYYHRLFEQILSNIQLKTVESFSEARQQIVAALYAIEHAIEGKEASLHNMLNFWKIPLTAP